MNKRNFYLFRRKRKDGRDGYEYIQHLVSASHDNGLSCSHWPEYAWRGKTLLDVYKMKYLISISNNYNDSNWELVIYNMEVEQLSWALTPEYKQYENLLNGKKMPRLNIREQEEFEIFKQKIENKWNKENTNTKETSIR